jgi:hypothetical protein
MLPLLALTSAVLFFVLLRTGVLDELPERLGGKRSWPKRRARRLLSDQKQVEEAKRLEVFKDFLEGEGEPEE